MEVETPPKRLVWVMAAAAGLSAGNLYYAQPLLDSIGQSLHASQSSLGLIITLTQLGYAAGLVVLVPLGDLFERRRMIVGVLFGTALALCGVALSPSWPVLAVCSLAVGTMSVVAQIVVPFAASLATDQNRGRVVGTVMSGLLLGILCARVVSGVVGDLIGWRGMYFLAAGLMVVLSLLLRFELPTYREHSDLRFSELLRSIGRLVIEEPLLRRRSLFGALAFACFSALWTTLTFLLARPPYSYREAVIGLFGLIGVAGALAASTAGRLADRGMVRQLTLAAVVLMLGSFALLAMGGTNLIALIAGIVVLDLAVQGLHITNQSVIYALQPKARSRITAVYMTAYFIGGAAGSATSAVAFDRFGWIGSCALGGGISLLALLLFVIPPPAPSRERAAQRG